jgi:putative transposase
LRRKSGTGYAIPNFVESFDAAGELFGMARIARVVAVGVPHHVTQRGNTQQDVFFTDQDRAVYLRILQDCRRRYHLRLLSYCLMTNHVHLVAVPETPDALARTLGRTHCDYARWLHVRQRTTGHLWQNRYFSCPLEARHLTAAMLYVEHNPVRAGLVTAAWEWGWSSARAHIAGTDERGLLDMSGWPELDSPEGWREALEVGSEEQSLAARIREATRTGRPLGDETFCNTLERLAGRRLLPDKRGRRPLPQAATAQMAIAWPVPDSEPAS